MKSSLEKWWDKLSEEWKRLYEINYVFEFRFSLQMKDELLSTGINPFQNYKFKLKKEFKRIEMVKETIEKLPCISSFHAADCYLFTVNSLNIINKPQFIDLCFNQLAKFDSSCDLSNLQYAYFEKNQLTDIKFIAKCGMLEELNIRENKLKSIEPVQYCKHLKFLDASNNKLTFLKSLENLNEIIELQLELNEISDFSILEHLPNLEILSIGYNPIKNFDFLFKIKKLKTLELDNELKKENVTWDKLKSKNINIIFK